MKSRMFLIFYAFSLVFFKLSSEEKPYVVGSIGFGLGNQLFQVATTCALAWDNEADPYFPDYVNYFPHAESMYNHIFFRCAIDPPKKKISVYFNTPVSEYQPIPFTNGMKLLGYSQNQRYFAHHRDRLIQLFFPNDNDLQYINNKYGWLLNDEICPNTVCIHVRYYFGEVPHQPEYRQFDEEYFEQAMQLFSNDVTFVVISDNINFAKKVISTKDRNVVFIENEPYYIDFFIQTFCKHNIISNSTFSWWGAWLNQNPEKIVVRPARWVDGYQDLECPDSWIRIQARSLQEKTKSNL
jgi:hypothetical protein